MGILHPTLYIFIEGAGRIVSEIAERTHPKDGMFSVQLNDGDDFERLLRNVKVNIQQNPGGLNIKRVNIYVVASAQSPPELVCHAGQAAKKLFSRDFSSYYITLAALLSETSAEDDYESRFEKNRKFIAAAECWSGVYNSVILLSDRNENGVITPANLQNGYEALAHLPLLQNSSVFQQQMAAKSTAMGRLLFTTLGFASFAPPEENGLTISMKNTLLKLAQHIEANLTHSEASPPPTHNQTTENIASHIISVAAKPLSRWQLLGHSLKDAERLLYNDRCATFYEENFTPPPPEPPTHTTLPLSQLAEKESQLRQQIASLESLTASLKSQLESKKTTSIGLFKNVDDIKNMIGDYYTTQHQLDIATTQLSTHTSTHKLIHEYLTNLHQVVTTIKSLPTTKPAPIKEPQAPLNIALLRDDGLIHEKHTLTLPNASYILRLAGGFTPQDL